MTELSTEYESDTSSDIAENAALETLGYLFEWVDADRFHHTVEMMEFAFSTDRSDLPRLAEKMVHSEDPAIHRASRAAVFAIGRVDDDVARDSKDLRIRLLKEIARSEDFELVDDLVSRLELDVQLGTLTKAEAEEVRLHILPKNAQLLQGQ